MRSEVTTLFLPNSTESGNPAKILDGAGFQKLDGRISAETWAEFQYSPIIHILPHQDKINQLNSIKWTSEQQSEYSSGFDMINTHDENQTWIEP